MPPPTVAFCVSESTSFRTLRPVADALPPAVTVEYLLLDDVLARSTRNDDLPAVEHGTVRRGSEYVNSERLADINRIERSQPLPEIALQRLVEDNLSPDLVYDLDGYLDDVDPDLFVSGHDLKPFIKHLIERCHEQSVPTAVVQHGINRPLLEDPDDVPGVPGPLTPTEDPRFPRLERLKRRVGFDYGAFVFCNPYVDELYTFGDFFTERLSTLRETYPCFGKTDVVSTGSAEFDPGGADPYDRDVDSVLFLSQWQFELGDWDADQQRHVVGVLERLRDRGLAVTVRPHPKGSDGKMARFFDAFDVSGTERLGADVAAHDMVLTVDSTAIFEGLLQGKPCGVVPPPWNPVTFRPFAHEHLLRVEDGTEDVASLAAERTTATQRDYLRRFCYVPAHDNDLPHDTPVEYISARLLRLAGGA